MMGRNILLVEGQDDACVIGELLCKHEVPESFEIRTPSAEFGAPGEGIDALLRVFRVRLKLPGIVGVVLDADTALACRWRQVSSVLAEADYFVPAMPQPEGTTFVSPVTPRPRVGVWLMPNNQLPGILEDFVSAMVPSDDALWPIAKNSVSQAMRVERRFPVPQQTKAEIHTWLAWQKKPGLPMGTALAASFLDHASRESALFISWIRTLFELSQSDAGDQP